MESRLEEAVQYAKDFPQNSIRSVAKKYEVAHTTLRYRLKRYVDRLDAVNLAVRPEFIVDAANAILRAKAPAAKSGDPPTVGVHWVTRFIQRHGYCKQRQKTLSAERAASEDLQRVVEYFQRLQRILEREGIQPDDIWNMDETGFRVGVGKDQLIVTKRKRSHYFSVPENRESATLIEAISAAGRFTPAFIILAGQNHMASWYHQQELDPETVIRPTPSGYTNDEISLDWVQHFDKHTNGCRKGRKRLLILDRHGSHHTKEFIEYCDAHGIIPSACPKSDTSTAATRCGGVPAVEALPRQSAGPHVRQVNKVARVIENGLGEVNEISPDLAHNMSRFIKGSLSNVAELLQTKKDLGRTRYAEKIAKQRRAMKNKVLQSGGVLTVQEGRAMVRRKEEDEVTKAREVIARMEAKAKNALKRWFNEAAKTARQWRSIGKLDRAEIYESGREVRLLKRF
ncbi:DDE superfamily endonuclease [Hirsutella rhossiliensis]